MKVGDKVYHRDTPDKVATIMSATIKKKKDYTDVRYRAIYEDGSVFTFRGCQVGKTILKLDESPFKQLNIFDYI